MLPGRWNKLETEMKDNRMQDFWRTGSGFSGSVQPKTQLRREAANVPVALPWQQRLQPVECCRGWSHVRAGQPGQSSPVGTLWAVRGRAGAGVKPALGREKPFPVSEDKLQHCRDLDREADWTEPSFPLALEGDTAAPVGKHYPACINHSWHDYDF